MLFRFTLSTIKSFKALFDCFHSRAATVEYLFFLFFLLLFLSKNKLPRILVESYHRDFCFKIVIDKMINKIFHSGNTAIIVCVQNFQIFISNP